METRETDKQEDDWLSAAKANMPAFFGSVFLALKDSVYTRSFLSPKTITATFAHQQAFFFLFFLGHLCCRLESAACVVLSWWGGGKGILSLFAETLLLWMVGLAGFSKVASYPFTPSSFPSFSFVHFSLVASQSMSP